MKVYLSAKLWEITTRWNPRIVHERGDPEGLGRQFRVATALFLQPKNK